MLLPFDDQAPAIRQKLSESLQRLAAERVFLGTSSWKYEGWLDQIYSRDRYLSRGRFSKKRFEAECLREYAETFPIVCGDFSFYQFPSPDYWTRLFHGAPDSLLFALKVPEDVTVKVFPIHPRYGPRGGMANETFLNVELFKAMFAEPLEPFRERVAALIFEFGSFSRSSYPGVEEFVSDLAPFLSALPPSFRYAVEIRNPEFLDPLYFSCLREHGVAHVFNAWTRMPEIGVQMRVRDSLTADFTVTRALLRRGRAYEDAVKMFTPYDRVQDVNPPTRESLRELIRQSKERRQAAYIFVNNRLEGNAPATIQAVVDE